MLDCRVSAELWQITSKISPYVVPETIELVQQRGLQINATGEDGVGEAILRGLG